MENGKTSLAKIEANRENAQQSTGPKTEEGKNAVKWNALKHGLLSKAVVIQVGEGKESEDEFESLLFRLQDNLQPIGTLEELLVEKIAVCFWRLRRVFRYETGEIQKEFFNDKWLRDFRERQLDPGDKPGRKVTPTEAQKMLDILDEIEQDYNKKYFLSIMAQGKLLATFKEDPAFVCELLGQNIGGWAYMQMTKNINEKQKKNFPLKPGLPGRQVIRLIEKEKRKIEDLKKGLEPHMKLELETKIANLTLPSREAMDKILRYETTIERQLYRAMGQLERLQRKRKGELTLPPISIDVLKDI